ncbi:MAG TPA: Gfo/Idh/MocA family oxidoreductase [Jiangellaceae bacterium]|nr:Gfo/Idh/MocA family oxidoreductase [Jiangellaceae bacterium]
MTTRVGLIGANGYGIHHRRVLTTMQATGTVEVVGMCDLAPVRDELEAPVPATARAFTDHRELLTVTRPEVVVVATPPHTHFELATDCARAGADVLLEKPPLLSMREHKELLQVLADTGRVCQVGFQALGSTALAEVLSAVRAGRLGRVTGIGAYGAWQRPDSYYDRSPWAGRRELAGRPVLDGALANPFAHVVMQALAAAAATEPVQIAEVEIERFRARPIDVDDTGAVRMWLASGLPLVVAVTLCADEHVDPVVVVHGERGRAMLECTVDRLRLPGEPVARLVPGRVGLLENLLAHRTGSGEVALRAGLDRTAPFTAVVESIMAAPAPTAVDEEYQRSVGDGAFRVVIVPGVTGVVRQAAERLRLPSELGAPWAAASPAG